MNYINAMTIFIRFAMAVDIDGNGSFQNQTEDVASSSRSAAESSLAHFILGNTRWHAISQLNKV